MTAVAPRPDEGRGRTAWVRAHLPSLTFAAVVLVAVPVIFHQGRDQWFFLDEWVFLVDRDLSPDGLFRPHNEHWTTVPVLVYRFLFRAVGLRSYVPYQAVVVGLHLASAVLLRVVMRRAGVSSWIATVTAGCFVVFGSGRQDIVWAFQMSFTGSLCFGLAQLLLADHDRPIGRRDVLAVAVGLVGVASSGVGVVMVAVVGAATLLRRGWRPAAVQVVPLAGAWLGWWLFYGQDGYGETAGPGGALSYGWNGLVNAVAKLSPVRGAGFVLAAVAVLGIVLIVRREGLGPAVRRLALPLCLAAGALAFLAVTGFGRAERTGNDVPQATRYVYLVGAMVLPLLAVAIDALARWRRVAGVAALVVLVAGVPANIEALRPQSIETFTLGSPRTVLVGARLPILRELPPDTAPFTFFEGPVTARWILDVLDAGRLADAPATTADERAAIALDLAVRAGPAPTPAGPCRLLVAPLRRTLDAGRSVSFEGPGVEVVLRYEGGRSAPLAFRAPAEAGLVALAGPLDLTVAPLPGGPVRLCG